MFLSSISCPWVVGAATGRYGALLLGFRERQETEARYLGVGALGELSEAWMEAVMAEDDDGDDEET